MAHTALLIERLLQFSLQHSLIGELDAYVARNTLLDLFGLSEPWADGVPEEHLDVPTVLLDALLDDAAARGLYDGEVRYAQDAFEGLSLMDTLMDVKRGVPGAALPPLRGRRSKNTSAAAEPRVAAGGHALAARR